MQIFWELVSTLQKSRRRGGKKEKCVDAAKAQYSNMNSSDVSVCVCLHACVCVRDLVFPDSPTAATFTCITHTCLLRRPESAALSPRLAAESQLRADRGAPGGAASVGVLCRKQLYHVIKAQICEPQSTVSQRLTGNFCACVCVCCCCVSLFSSFGCLSLFPKERNFSEAG